MKRVKFEKEMLVAIVGVVMMVVGLLMGFKDEVVEVENKKVTVEYVWEQQGDEQELDGFYLENGDVVVMLSDESFALMNREKNQYLFLPIDLGDWDYELENETQLENIIKTYLSMKNTGTY